MKIWRFYTKPGSFFGDKYELYAITNKKKIAKQFMEERDMDCFIMKSSKESPSLWAELANDHQDQIIKAHPLCTSYITDEGVIRMIDVPIVCTMYEYQTADSDFADIYITTSYFWDRALPPQLFNRKVLDALSVLQYDKMYKVMSSKAQTSDYDDYDGPNTNIDEVGLLISTFKYTFK